MPGGGSRKATHDIAPVIRRAFVAAASRLGKGDSEAGLRKLLEKSLAENPLATLQAISKFLPRENIISGEVKHDHKHEHVGLSETAAWITETLGEQAQSASEKPLSH